MKYRFFAPNPILKVVRLCLALILHHFFNCFEQFLRFYPEITPSKCRFWVKWAKMVIFERFCQNVRPDFGYQTGSKVSKLKLKKVRYGLKIVAFKFQLDSSSGLDARDPHPFFF